MAARQDQTLVIVNIVCIILFLLCAALAYVGFKGRSDANQQLASTSKSLQDTQTQVRTIQADAEDLRNKVGVGPTDSREAIETAFKDDIQKYAPGMPEGATYRLALANLSARYETTAASEAQVKNQVVDLTNRLQQLEKEKDAQIASVDAERKKTVESAAAALNTFNEDRARIDAEKQQLLLTLESQKAGFESQITALDTESKQLKEQMAKMQATITRLIEGAKPALGSFEVADGSVSHVSQTGTVWIDLGSADALRPLVTFSIYDADVRDASKMDPKGTIEVTMVMGEHQAEARITSDDPRNPILRGDRIYSPAWQRGRPLHFAFTGIIDVNDDGVSDLQLVRNLVGLNQSVVDAFLSDDGSVEGAMTVSTRYLVLGDLPSGASRIKHNDGWQAMNKEAASLGVETITLDQFLDQMGYRPDTRAVQLGSTANARDFPAQANTEATTQGERAMPSRFRPRSPVSPPSATTPPPPASTPR